MSHNPKEDGLVDEELESSDDFVRSLMRINNYVEIIVANDVVLSKRMKFYYLGLFRLLMDRFDSMKIGEIVIKKSDIEDYFTKHKYLISDDEFQHFCKDMENSYRDSLLKDEYINKDKDYLNHYVD